MIDYERVEKALGYLAKTDVACAELKAEVERTAYKIKASKATIILHTDGTGPVKQATAETHLTVAAAAEEHFTAIKDYGAMMNERARNNLVIDVWRSINSARNKGQII